MQVMAALGDAPTAAIAVVAILLGVLLVARGPREKRAAGAVDEAEPTPTLLNVPISPAPDVEPGFVGPEGEVVGHGPIRLGAVGPLSGSETAAAPAPAPSEPQPAPAPGPDEPEEPKDPAWRVAARTANSAVHFRQGAIKIGGKPAGKRKDH
jgi:hypothetical protein